MNKPKCVLCENAEATTNRSKVTGKLQMCDKCFRTTTKR